MQTTIYKNTFKGCSSIKHVVLPNSISAIEEGAFQNCTSLQHAEIGQNVEFVGTSAFCGDLQLEKVDRFDDTNPSHTFDIVGNYAFCGTGLKKVNLSLRSSSIYSFWGDGCFQDCTDLSEVNILSANYLSKEMFKNCTSLRKVSYNVNLMAYTYPRVFENCVSLTSMTLPSQLLFISEGMFKDCTSLKWVRFNEYDASKSGIQLVQKNAFYNTPNCFEIHFPASINTLDEIEDAALSNSNVQELNLHGIDKEVCGTDKQLPEDVWYGKPYTVTTVEQLKKINELRILLKVPIAVVVEFKFSYFPYEYYHDNIEVYLSYMSKTDINKKITNYGGEIEEFKNKPMLQLDSLEYDGTTYSCKLKKGLFIRVVVDLGNGNGHTPADLIKDYNKKSYIQYRQKNFDYNVLTFLQSSDLKLYSQISRTSAFAFYINSSSSTTEKLTKWGVHIAHGPGNSVDKTIYTAIYRPRTTTTFYSKCASLKQETQIQVQNVTLTDTLRLTKIFRANFYTGYVRLKCSDGNLLCKSNTVAPIPYVEPIKYPVDTTTTDNFKTGKWYYNARELYNYAIRTHKPVLFIYSLLGCGPCQIYQKNIWENAAFQAWAAKQKFLLCGMEVDSQPYYNQQLAFCVNELSPNAKNFAKRDEGQTVDAIQSNAFDEKFYRYKNDLGQLASNLMTPVIVLMDSSGNRWDYTYHNIANHIRDVGVDGVIQCLKSLCLYHFSNNDINDTTYVVDAVKAFNKYEYITYNDDNPWQISDNAISLAKSGISTVEAAIDEMLEQLRNMGQDNGGLYLGGCLIIDIDFLQATFDPQIEFMTTADELNREYSKWYILIGNKYYQLSASASNYKVISNPCGANNMKIFLTTLVEKTYPN